MMVTQRYLYVTNIMVIHIYMLIKYNESNDVQMPVKHAVCTYRVTGCMHFLLVQQVPALSITLHLGLRGK